MYDFVMKKKNIKMPTFSILSCEVAFFSLLIGAYFYSVALGLVILAGSGLILYGLFQNFYKLQPFIWGISLLCSFTALLWGGYVDFFLGTNFIAICSGILFGILGYFFNKAFIYKYPF